MINKNLIKEQALQELQEEEFRKAVDKMKQKLRTKRKWFPWRLVLINLNKENSNVY